MKTLHAYVAVFFLLISVQLHGVEEDDQRKTVEQEFVTEKSANQFDDIVAEIQQVQQAIKDNRQEQQSNQKNPQSLIELERSREQLEIQLRTLNKTVEQLVTGPADVELFSNQPSNFEEFDWRAELKEIVKPVFSELRRLTEKPRQLEALREQENLVKERLQAAKLALDSLSAYGDEADQQPETSVIKKLVEKWTSRKETQERELLLIQYQLEQRLQDNEQQSQSILKSFEQFVTGSGFHFVLAVLAFLLTFFLLKMLANYLAMKVNKNKDREERRFHTRLINLFSQVFIVLISIAAVLITLIVLGDRVLLGLAIVTIVFILFSLRNSLPNYFNEIRTLMNVGSARENERIIYNGIPWKLVKINFYSVLVNPRLTGGRIRLPLKIVTELISRPNGKGEAWFPTRSGDHVILGDGTFGKVRMQTPEMVSLSLFDQSDKSYPTADFIAANPRNLSDGFGFNVTFGLDYGIQSQITGEVMTTMQQSLQEKMSASDFSEHLQSCAVEFQDAGASSLDLALILMFDGDASAKYLKLERLIKTFAVDICNEQGWSIPFSQLTVHMADQAGE